MRLLLPNNKNQPPLRRRVPTHRRAFSLVEAMVSLSLLSMVGVVLLASALAASNSTTQSMDELIASGIAQQVIDEAMGLSYVTKSYTSSDPNAVDITDMGNSANTGSRYGGNWGDIDDYNGASPTSTYTAQPPTDYWGAEYGQGAGTNSSGTPGLRNSVFRIRDNFFDNWRLETNCYYVNPADLTQRLNSGTSMYRAIEVRVYRVLPDNTKVPLANLRRVHCHVPKPKT